MRAIAIPLVNPLPVDMAGGLQRRGTVPASWGSLLVDGSAVVALALIIPFVILAVGTPLALALLLVLKVARLAVNAF